MEGIMLNTLTLQIPDYLYQSLRKRAIEVGQTPEQMIIKYVEEELEETESDPLLDLAGIFECENTDISENHDGYIGIFF
jgi:hypothetical protein